MKTILILGAGRSSPSLITYLLNQAASQNWKIVIGDADIESSRSRVPESPHVELVRVAMQDQERVRGVVSESDVVISLLPPTLHPEIARLCLAYKKHLITASYVSPEMKGLHADALAAGLLFLNECGLDPGIDHMSAMQVIDGIKRDGGHLTAFESFTGGLIHPETDPQNPWRYKFTWNPRNVVTAGQAGATFLHRGERNYIPYKELFSRITSVHVNGYGDYEGYANRDSLGYIDLYGLQGIRTMLRGTLRERGFCTAWNVFVQLGCCDDTYEVNNAASMTHRGFLDFFLKPSEDPTDVRLARQLGLDLHGAEIACLKWSGFFDDEPINATGKTPARLLEHILNKKWKLAPGDKDRIVMWHRFVFTHNGLEKQIHASMVIDGDDSIHTAMAKTVGWPLGIAAGLLLQGKIPQRGVVIPIVRDVYDPVLKALGELGVTLEEKMV